ncbi:hypothetical protein AB7008_40995 [Bradyrhizobium sp. 521_C7_N1_3]|uniref:hypothetical protein n=1 Tax=Bradyrhizobium sp. 521_C7_N1_3 TaxID=3240368 RepID=UPI003F893E05
MIPARMLAIICIFEATLTAAAFAKDTHRRAATIRDPQPVKSLRISNSGGLVVRQDLFDRRDPNNFRSDWPSPPAQPGQF